MSQFTSAIADVFKLIRSTLLRSGVKIGTTAQLPRVEIHSVVEDVPQTKDNALRSITATIEAISGEKIADVITLLEGNIERIFADAGLSLTGYNVIGVVPGQIRLFDEQVSQDTQAVYYRCLQDVTIYVEKVESTDDVDEDTTETN